jgi:hypothetical protein
MQSHPNHWELPEGAVDDATEVLVWCHAGEDLCQCDAVHVNGLMMLLDRVLFKTSNAPFSKEDAQEMSELMKTVGGN